MNDPLVIDLETTLHNVGDEAIGNFAADPHSPDNWIVWAGVGYVDFNNPEQLRHELRRKFTSKEEIDLPPPAPGTVLVGHNVKFDLEYLAGPNNKQADAWYEWITNPASMVWDTMVAEYRIRGQFVVNPSLDFSAMVRGWPTKPGRLKEYWNKGISTEDIPDDEVDPYLSHDINTTGRLFVDQIRYAQQVGMMPLLQEEMGSMLALTSAELNGMHFDRRGAMTYYENIMSVEIADMEAALVKAFIAAGAPELAVNPGSTKFMNVLLYGGSYNYEYREPLLHEDGTPVVFKTGKKKGLPRSRIVKTAWETTARTRAGTGKVDEETLVVMADHASTNKALSEALLLLLRWRKKRKQAGTYYQGYSKLTWPHDSKLHGSLNQTVVATGRLSSSTPNLQNAAHGPIRKHFPSRLEGGRMMEIDESQIEVVVQGVLSGDETMLADLHKGVDFHSKRAAIAAGVEYELVRQAYLDEDPVWSKKRKDAKIFSFQRAYGAGAAKIALTTGMRYKDVMTLIGAEEDEYPGVVELTKGWEREVAKSAGRVGDDVLGKLTSKTGARYIFKREMFHGQASFRPTMIKNYPIQGLAGDIVKLILNRIRRVVWDWNQAHKHRVWFVNTVHDSLVFDVGRVTDTEAKDFAQQIHHVMTKDVDVAMRDKFGLDFQGLIKADAEIGHNWYGYDKDSNLHGMRGLEL